MAAGSVEEEVQPTTPEVCLTGALMRVDETLLAVEEGASRQPCVRRLVRMISVLLIGQICQSFPRVVTRLDVAARRLGIIPNASMNCLYLRRVGMALSPEGSRWAEYWCDGYAVVVEYSRGGGL